MRSKEIIFAEVAHDLAVISTPYLRGEVYQQSILETLLDCRELLSERHTRREKGKEVCGECGGAKKVIGSYQEGEQTGKIFPVYKPCPSCQPANTN